MEEAIRLCLADEKNCYLAKSDLKSAFRHLPIRPQDWNLLVMIAHHPTTGKKYYFYDKCTPFGHSISCSHFQRVCNAIEAIFHHRTGSRANNYFDDFLFVQLRRYVCNQLVQPFLDISSEMNFPVSLEETLGDNDDDFFRHITGHSKSVSVYFSQKKRQSHKSTAGVI